MKSKRTKPTNYKINISQKVKYYEHIVHNIYSILSNHSAYSVIKSCVVKDKENNGYLIKSFSNSSDKEKKEHLLILQDFESDLKEHLFYDKPFKIIFQDEKKLYDEIFERLNRKLYEYSGEKQEVSDDDFDPFEHDEYFRPSIEEFKKVVKCLEPLVFSFYPIMKSLPDLQYAKTIMELDNKKAFENKSNEQIKDILEYDSLAISSLSHDNDDLEIKSAINTYLYNKNSVFKKINNKHFEKLLWSNLKANFIEDYSIELANKFPNLLNQAENLNSVVNLSSTKIYCVNIDVQSVLDKCLHILDYKELSKVMTRLNESVSLYKPKDINFINVVNENEKVNIIIGGHELNENLAINIGNIFERMIYEYNSNNVSRKTHSFQKDKEFLNKAAETFWLDIELDNQILENKQKKLKI
jgi:hypothetical protein